jgi:hypothetical protein
MPEPRKSNNPPNAYDVLYKLFSWLLQGDEPGKTSVKRIVGVAALVVAAILAFKSGDLARDKAVILTFAGIGAVLLGLTAIPGT